MFVCQILHEHLPSVSSLNPHHHHAGQRRCPPPATRGRTEARGDPVQDRSARRAGPEGRENSCVTDEGTKASEPRSLESGQQGVRSASTVSGGSEKRRDAWDSAEPSGLAFPRASLEKHRACRQQAGSSARLGLFSVPCSADGGRGPPCSWTAGQVCLGGLSDST